MPFVHILVGRPLADGQKVMTKSQVGQAISLLPGKSEENLMICIDDDVNLFYRGHRLLDGSCTNVRLFCPAPLEAKQAFTKAMYEILSKLSVAGGWDSYLTFEELPEWGMNGTLK